MVITTRNEELNLANCLSSLQAQTFRDFEVIVVDNSSTDATTDVALMFGVTAVEFGPERSAQRNFGIMELASGCDILFLDADMIVSPLLLEMANASLDLSSAGLYIEEVVVGCSVHSRVRRFERGFYSGTVVDCVRYFRRSDFIQVGGFDTGLTGPEDWDFDRRLADLGRLKVLDSGIAASKLAPCTVEDAKAFTTFVGLFHNESNSNARKHISKKKYYGQSMSAYVNKWGLDDPIIRKQLGLKYRFWTVFVENGKWRRIIRHPFLALLMLTSRVLIAVTYLRSRV